MRWLGLLAAACTGSLPLDSAETGLAPVLEGPEITHDPPEPPFFAGEPIAFQATASDPDGVDALELFARTRGGLSYQRVPMEPDADGVYHAELPGWAVDAPAIEYYVRAFDASPWRVARTLPARGAEAPLSLPVGVIPVAVPFVERFDGTTTSFGLYERGWTEAALGFRGARWTVGGPASSGDGAAVHPRGYPGIAPVDDWLVSPVLDLSGLATAEVRWLEYGERTDRAVAHSLWISTGSPDPADGEFTPVRSLPPPPEGVWSRPEVVDLGAWVGEPAVTLAWRYEGGDTDLWVIDDVQVRAFGPDLRLVSATHGRADPGGTVGIDLVVWNAGAPTAGPVQVSLDVDPSRGAPGGVLQLDALGTGEQAGGRLGLDISVDHPDNALLPTAIVADDGVDVFRFPFDVLVGDPTTGLVRLQTSAPGVVQVWMGTGDPRQPHVEVPVFLGGLQAGVYTFSVDLADHTAYLPSEPGRLRWWVRLNTQEPSQLLGFGIDFDGQTTWTETVGPFPPAQDAHFYLPGRARPVVVGAASDPAPLAPGVDALVSLSLRNDGGPTTGRTWVRLASGHPNLSVGVAELEVAASGWGPGELATLSVPVQVAAGHVDSTPLPLSVTLFDTIELVPVEPSVVALPVPWPDVRFDGPSVADPDGDADGLLDPGERANLIVSIRNDGALPTGPLVCELTRVNGPAIALHTTGALVGPLASGAVVTASFDVEATQGAVGDEVVLRLDCAESGRSWSSVLSVVLGQRGWVSFPPDPVGDVASGGAVDLRTGRWRVDGGLLELELTSAVPLDPAALQLEVWMRAPGSAWPLHAVTVLNGVGQLWGVQFGGFNPIGPAPITPVDAHTARITLDLAAIGPGQQAIQVAFGAGFCATGAPYCDAWPDDWGNPYVGGLDPTTWHPITW